MSNTQVSTKQYTIHHNDIDDALYKTTILSYIGSQSSQDSTEEDAKRSIKMRGTTCNFSTRM